MQDFRKLRAWHAANELALRVIDSFPESTSRRAPDLRSQTIRAAHSVPGNLAEGCSKSSRADLLRYVEIAHGSLNELDSRLILANRARMLRGPDVDRLPRDIVVTRKMLIALARTLQYKIALEENARRGG